MMISTKGRYALRVMIDLAKQPEGVFIPLTDVASRQEISEKYLESIVSSLAKKGMVDSVRGKKGGYRLNRRRKEYTVLEILKATEKSLAPVSCLETETNTCARKDNCATLQMWQEVNQLVGNYFENVTIADLMEKEQN